MAAAERVAHAARGAAAALARAAARGGGGGGAAAAAARGRPIAACVRVGEGAALPVGAGGLARGAAGAAAVPARAPPGRGFAAAAAGGGGVAAGVRPGARAAARGRAAARRRAAAPVPEPAAALAALPASERALAPLLSHRALVVTREIEWGQLVLGFEQANRYTIRDETGAAVGYLAEETTALSMVGRQLLRQRRGFTATLLDADGELLMRVKRPPYLVSSTARIEDARGNVIGEVFGRWSPTSRNYDIFLGERQVARVRAGFLAWEFVLEDEAGAVRAVIDRNFQGFGKELFTDAGKYAIHFANEQEGGEDNGLRAPPGGVSRHAPPPGNTYALERASAGPGAGDASALIAPIEAPLGVSERALALACAISVDFDYFSQHSRSGGVLSPFGLGMPIPVPMPAPAPSGADSEAEAPGVAGGAGAAGGAAGSAGAAADPSAYELDLGEDEDAGGEASEWGDLGGDRFDLGGGGGDGGSGGWGWSDPNASESGQERSEDGGGGGSWWGGDGDGGDDDDDGDGGFFGGDDDGDGGGGFFDALGDMFGGDD